MNPDPNAFRREDISAWEVVELARSSSHRPSTQRCQLMRVAKYDKVFHPDNTEQQKAFPRRLPLITSWAIPFEPGGRHAQRRRHPATCAPRARREMLALSSPNNGPARSIRRESARIYVTSYPSRDFPGARGRCSTHAGAKPE